MENWLLKQVKDSVRMFFEPLFPSWWKRLAKAIMNNKPIAKPHPHDPHLQDLVETTHYSPTNRVPNPHSPAAAQDVDDEEVEGTESKK